MFAILSRTANFLTIKMIMHNVLTHFWHSLVDPETKVTDFQSYYQVVYPTKSPRKKTIPTKRQNAFVQGILLVAQTQKSPA
jgi:hypothetical protein